MRLGRALGTGWVGVRESAMMLTQWMGWGDSGAGATWGSQGEASREMGERMT